MIVCSEIYTGFRDAEFVASFADVLEFVVSLSWRVLSQQKSGLSQHSCHVLILVLTWQDLLRQNSCHRKILPTFWIPCWHGRICCDIKFIRRETCVFTCWRGMICYDKTLGSRGLCLFTCWCGMICCNKTVGRCDMCVFTCWRGRICCDKSSYLIKFLPTCHDSLLLSRDDLYRSCTNLFFFPNELFWARESLFKTGNKWFFTHDSQSWARDD